jgi:hypothetical protein
LLALVSGISGNGPSRSNLEASQPKAIDNEAMPLSGCPRNYGDSLRVTGMQQLYPSLKTVGYGDDLVNCPRNPPSLAWPRNGSRTRVRPTGDRSGAGHPK